MSGEESKRVFAKNLKKFLDLNEKQPVDLVRDLGLPFSTVSNWMNAEKMPRMGNVELLAKYFNCQKSDLIEDKGTDIPETYYLNDDARDLAEFLFKNPKYKVLFDASRKVKPDDIEFVKQLIDRMGGNDD